MGNVVCEGVIIVCAAPVMVTSWSALESHQRALQLVTITGALKSYY